MTVDTIEIVQELIEEMQEDGLAIDSAWEYTNKTNNKIMFAIFMPGFCDIQQSPCVKDSELIWSDGEFIGKYKHLNVQAEAKE